MKKIGYIYFTDLTDIKAVRFTDYFEEFDCFDQLSCRLENEITLLKYTGDGMYEEFYTGLHLPFLESNVHTYYLGKNAIGWDRYRTINEVTLSQKLRGNYFNKKYSIYRNLSYKEIIKLFEEAIENPLFVTRIYKITEEEKKIVGSQIKMADYLQKQILSQYNCTKSLLESECEKFKRKQLNENLDIVYGENVLYDFQKSMNRKLKR